MKINRVYYKTAIFPGYGFSGGLKFEFLIFEIEFEALSEDDVERIFGRSSPEVIKDLNQLG